ncbi:MAG: riboflavin biosynthesis protein RibF [Clostridia bacterium]|nr:riboflavin biosynthesis protein RibF [Clostridia bacterium]
MNIYNRIPELKSTAIALGCFDGIHIGHQAVIKALRQPDCETLDQAVFSFSDAPAFKKGAELIASYEDKCDILSEMGIEALILPAFDSVRDYSPEAFFRKILIGKLDARLLACGENYRFGKYAAGDSGMLRRLCEEQGIGCVVVPSVLYGDEPVSSSRIRAALGAGDVQTAAKMLGRLFSYRLEVVNGRKLGRRLGTPTINQVFPADFLIPAYGVYASVTEVEGVRYPSVTNIGVKPTVGAEAPLSETWIIGYNGDLYGRFVRVSLVSFMRRECKFPSIDALKQAIHSDSIKSVGLTRDYLK